MDSAVYDVGGVQERFGPIPVEADEPVFHHPWERRVFSSLLLACAMLGISEEAFRWARSAFPRRSISPATTSGGSEPSSNCCSIEGCSLQDSSTRPSPESARRSAATRSQASLRRAVSRGFVRTAVGPMPHWLARLYPRIQDVLRPKAVLPRFAVGDRVVVSAAPTSPAEIHTRRPRYTWGKRGTVVCCHGPTVLPERSASGEHGASEHFYTVEFDGRELWGDGAEPGTGVRIDLFESYLEAMP